MRLLALAIAALTLAGCIATPQTAPVDTSVPPAMAGEVITFDDLEGTLLALPVAGGEAQFDYEVPVGARWLGATLTWRTRGTILTLSAVSPEGDVAGDSRTLAGSSPRSPARLDWWTADPAPGAWIFTVRGQAALQEPVLLQLHTLPHVSGMHVAQHTTVPPGSFVEVNLEMLAGQTFTYSWETAAPVGFNIHTHRDGVTKNVVEETTDRMAANFTADEDGGYSLLWALESGGLPGAGTEGVELTYRVDGAYELHSGVG